MTFLPQLTVLGVFIGLSVFLAKKLPERVTLAINAFAAGCLLFFIVMTTSTVINRASEMFGASNKISGLIGDAWVFLALSAFAIFVIPLILVFAVGERRPSVIVAIAMGLLNLGLALSLAGDAMTGITPLTVLTISLMACLFLLEGLLMGARLMKTKVTSFFVYSLGLIAGLPALVGFNLTSIRSVELLTPFSYAVSAGFMIFYLPFILGLGHSPNDIKWHFTAMISGLFVSGSIVTALLLFSL